jgi:hypothetical protein
MGQRPKPAARRRPPGEKLPETAVPRRSGHGLAAAACVGGVAKVPAMLLRDVLGKP